MLQFLYFPKSMYLLLIKKFLHHMLLFGIIRCDPMWRGVLCMNYILNMPCIPTCEVYFNYNDIKSTTEISKTTSLLFFWRNIHIRKTLGQINNLYRWHESQGPKTTCTTTKLPQIQSTHMRRSFMTFRWGNK